MQKAKWPVSVRRDDDVEYIYYRPSEMEADILRQLNGADFLGEFSDANGEPCALRILVTMEREP